MLGKVFRSFGAPQAAVTPAGDARAWSVEVVDRLNWRLEPSGRLTVTPRGPPAGLAVHLAAGGGAPGEVRSILLIP
jgi:hypothetical protein